MPASFSRSSSCGCHLPPMPNQQSNASCWHKYCCGLPSTTDHSPTHSLWVSTPQQTLLRSNHDSNVKGFWSMGPQSPRRLCLDLHQPRDQSHKCRRLDPVQTLAQLRRMGHVLESPPPVCQLSCNCHVSFPMCDLRQLRPRSPDRSNPSAS